MTTKELEKRLDKLVQTVQRCEGAKKINGQWCSRCVTCGKICTCFGKGCMQGGHFIPRGCRITRWNKANVHNQCTRCNGFLNGNYIMYGLYMQKKYPEEYIQLTNLFMEHKKGTAPKLKPLDIKKLYNEWLKEGRELEEKLGEPIFPKSWDYVTI